MKKIISHIVFTLLILFIGVSCDFVENANPPLEPTTAGGTGVGIDITDSTTNSDPNLKKVLVEDYTGHKCGNCPAAADELKNLEILYPGKIVPLAIHAGSFANNTPVLSYPTSFTTTAGNAYNNTFLISSAGNPNGLINRVGYGTGGFIKAYTVWGSEISQQITQVPKFQILIKYKYNTGTLKLNADIKVKSLSNNAGTYKLVVLLSEDSIIAEQLDYRLPTGSQLITNYEFNHVLRGAINSEWGDPVFIAGATLNTTEIKSITNFQINSKFKSSKCHIIAFIYDADLASPTSYEVFQAEELKLK